MQKIRLPEGARTWEGTWLVVEIFSAAPAIVPSNQCRLEPRQEEKLSDPSIRVGRRECGWLDHESKLSVAV